MMTPSCGRSASSGFPKAFPTKRRKALFTAAASASWSKKPFIIIEFPKAVEEVGIIFEHPLELGQSRRRPLFPGELVQERLLSLLHHVGRKHDGGIEHVLQPLSGLPPCPAIGAKRARRSHGRKWHPPKPRKRIRHREQIDVVGPSDVALRHRKHAVEARACSASCPERPAASSIR